MDKNTQYYVSIGLNSVGFHVYSHAQPRRFVLERTGRKYKKKPLLISKFKRNVRRNEFRNESSGRRKAEKDARTGRI